MTRSAQWRLLYVCVCKLMRVLFVLFFFLLFECACCFVVTVVLLLCLLLPRLVDGLRAVYHIHHIHPSPPHFVYGLLAMFRVHPSPPQGVAEQEETELLTDAERMNQI